VQSNLTPHTIRVKKRRQSCDTPNVTNSKSQMEIVKPLILWA